MTKDALQTLAVPGMGQQLQTVCDFFLDVIGAEGFGPLSSPVRIGTAPGNDVVVTDATVSRFHCAISRTVTGLMLTDESSTNGTFVDNVRVKQAYLTDGAKLRVGKTEFQLRMAKTPRVETVEVKSAFGELLGGGPAMRALFAMLARLANSNVPVLIEGETGTGKELVARALHSEGRPRKSFVVVDCGAIAPTLIESELFGHERGAFTGADQARPGAFEQADGGTVFLDEIGELPLNLQPKLLRVLERGTIRRLGGQVEKKIQVRVVAATHRDLRRMVNEERFREDLYFRLAVCPVQIPPLKDRTEDIGMLAQHFFTQAYSGAMPDPVPNLDDETVRLLASRSWPGNVRELRNVIERLIILGDPDALARGAVAEDLRRLSLTTKSAQETVTLEEAKRRAERAYLVRLLTKFPEDREAAAEEAGLHPKSLPRLIRRHGLRP